MEKTTKNRIKKYLALLSAIMLLFSCATSLIACGSGRGKAEDFLPNVVRISSGVGYGSGVITMADEDGLICLTNYHVVMNSPSIQVTISDTTADAELLGYSDYHDIAVLKIYADAPEGLTEVRTAEAKEGKPNHSIGNANNDGVVIYGGECIDRDAIMQTDRLSTSGVKFVPTIKTTAKIVQGMSGGAFLDSNGNLIGITSYSGTEADYAVPIDIAMAVQTAALSGKVEEEHGRVNLIGNPAYGAAYDSNDFIGIAVSQTSFAPLPEGFVGSIEKNKEEGIRVIRTGTDCSVKTDDLITKIGDLKITADNKNAVFAEFYRYSTDGTGKPLTVTLSSGETKEIKGYKLKA